MSRHLENQLAGIQSGNPSANGTRNLVSDSLFKRLARGLKRYWFVAVPAIMLNVGITLDHVIAKNNENDFRVRIKKVALEALEASKSQDDAPLSETLRAHWITTNTEGNLDGRISAIEPSQSSTVPIEKLDVALLKKGEKIRRATTDNDGKFILEDVKPGVYTLIAAGRNGFLAYGVHVLPKLQKFDVLEGNTNVDPQKLKQDYYVSHFGLPQDSVVVENLQIDAAAVPPEYSTLQRISQNYLPSTEAFSAARDQDDAKAIGKATNIRNGFKHPLAIDGSFEGRIQPIATDGGQAAKLSEMNVFLIQEDIEAARVAVEENGRFKIEDVDPGVYSLVAAGKDGFAALSVQLQSADAVSATATGKTKAYYVSNRAVEPRVAEPLGIAIVTDPDDVQVIKQEVNRIFNERQQLLAQQDPFNQFPDQGPFPGDLGTAPIAVDGGFPVDTGFAGTAATGPVYGGSGASPFVGGRGRIAALIGLTVGTIALATDEDGGDPQPTSPFLPETLPALQDPPGDNPLDPDPPVDNPLDPDPPVDNPLDPDPPVDNPLDPDPPVDNPRDPTQNVN